MLSIGRLGSGREAYYLGKVAAGPEDYYTGAGEAAGSWLGSGAAELGLSGPVQETDLHLLMAGFDPGTRRALVVNAGWEGRRPGFDLTFSAPKGVSLLALAGPPEVAQAATVAHEDGVAQAFGYLERAAARVRRGHDGTAVLPAQGLVGAAFRHRTSRTLDPQLHTHVLVANLARAGDGRWSALDARALYRHARTAGFLYQAALRHNLVRSLGVEWGPVRKGMAEPAGFTSAQLEEFSGRRAQVQSALERRGASSARAAQVAAWRSRPAKEEAPAPESLRTGWLGRAASVGLGPEAIAAVTGRGREPMGPTLVALVERLAGADGLTAHESHFDRRAALRAVAEAHAEGIPVSTAESLAEHFLSSEPVVSLTPAAPADEQRWTTRELLAIEEAMLARATARRDSGTAVVSPRLVTATLDGRPQLSQEQREMVRRLLASGAGVEVVVGVPGSGKTYALDAARDAWQRSGHTVFGAALAGRAAAELSAGAGVPATTLSRLLADLERGGADGAIGRRSVVLLDEAGMVGTRDLARLVDFTARAGAKLVLVGDPRQLPEIEAGGSLSALVDRLGAVELVDNRRQVEGWERTALALLREGQVARSVASYDSHQRISVSLTAPEARAALVADWWEARSQGVSAVMLGVRRSDVAELNALGRALMREHGRLGSLALDAGGRSFAVGDEVVPLRNDRRLGVVNGVRAVVVELDPVGRNVTLEDHAGRRVLLGAYYLDAGHLGHSYASTVHKFQGATVERAFLLGSDALYQEAGYVGLSRARLRTDLYVVAPDEQEKLPERRKTGAVTELLDALANSRAQTLATDLLLTGEASPDRLARLDARRAELADHLLATLPAAGRESWARAHTDELAEHRQLGREAEAARRALGRALTTVPPGHLVAELGPPPTRRPERTAWAEAAVELECYRHRSGLAPSERVLERAPDRSDERRRDWERLTRAAARAGIEVEPGRERGIEHPGVTA